MALFVKDKRPLWNVGAVLVLAISLLWPAFINGEPFYMPDTTSYVRGADAAVYHLTGHPSVWTGEYFKRYASDPVTSDDATSASGQAANDGAPTSSASPPPPKSAEAPVVLLGRSIYYGLLLYTSQLLGSFWAVVVLQALLIATAIALTIAVLGRALGEKRDAPSIIVRGVLVAAFTSAGYFASYLLPDVFGALALLAFGHLVFLWEENWRASRLFWFALLAVAMLFHLSNFLLVSVLAVGAAILLLLRLRLPLARKGLLAVGAALAIAVMGQGLFSWAVRHETGYPPVAPPFVAARIIADGPGYRYLRDHCPEVRLIYCRAVRFKTLISDSLLWSTDPNEGIFQALTPAEQRIAAAQQMHFVLAVFKERPLDLIGSSIGAFFRQLKFFKLATFNYAPVNISYFEAKIPSPFIDHARQSKAYRGIMPVHFIEWATLATVLVSTLAIFWVVVPMISRSKRLSRPGAFLLFMLIGVVMNALICGAVSTPKGRYQMRLVWVLPLAVLASRRLFPWEQVEQVDHDNCSQSSPYSLPAQ